MKMKSRVTSMVLLLVMILGVLPLNLVEAVYETENIKNINKWIEYVKFSKDHDESEPTIKKTDNQEKVAIDSVIQIKFKGKLDKRKLVSSRIKLSSNDGDYFVIHKDDIWINYDDENDVNNPNKFNGDILKIDLSSFNRKGNYPLRKNTLYKLTLEQRAVELKEQNIEGKTINDEINIHFVTGDDANSGGGTEGLSVEGYSSDIKKQDEITRLLSTKLGEKDSNIKRDGKSIYIHLNEEIRWNTDVLTLTNNSVIDKKISLNKNELDKYFKFYRVPKAYVGEKNTEFRYNEKREVHFRNSTKMEKLGIKSVEILIENGRSNIIKVTPEDYLTFYNIYYLKLEDKNIIKDVYGRKLENDIDKYIWTTNDSKNDTPVWRIDKTGDPYDEDKGQITAEEIIKNTNSPSNEDVTAWRLYGVPKYNEYINSKTSGKPIIINIDGEVVPNPKDNEGGYLNKIEPNDHRDKIYIENTLEKIKLKEELITDEDHSVDIKWYKLEYVKDKDGKTNTVLSLYPKGELDAGKPYQLIIEKDTFVNRSAKQFKDKLTLKFIIEGQKSQKKGIYSVLHSQQPQVFSTYYKESVKGPLELDIRGFNFTEDIKNIRFVNVLNGKEIILPYEYKYKDDDGNDKIDKNIEFINVDHIKATLKGELLDEFLKQGSGGSYELFIDFKSGGSAKSLEDEKFLNKLIVYEKPYVIDTNPKKNDWNVDKNSVYKSFSNGQSGNYLTVMFHNINGSLESGELDLDMFKLSKESNEDDDLLDPARKIVYEGFNDTNTLKKFTVKTSGIVVEGISTPYTTGKLYLDDEKYLEKDTIKVTLFDKDLYTNDYPRKEALVKVTRGGETKDLILRETGINTGKFEGQIEIWKPADMKAPNINEIKVEYIDLQSSTGATESPVVETAKIEKTLEYRRRAQLYIEKYAHEKGDKVKVILHHSGANEKYDEIEEVKVEVINGGTLTLKETGKNTGIFEYNDVIPNLSADFELTYKYELGKKALNTDNIAKVHIPIKNALEDNEKYIAQIPEGAVRLKTDIQIEEKNKRNDKYEWSFKTSVLSKVDITFQGSVPEEYDDSYPLILRGEYFSNKTEVYFVDTSGKEHKMKTEVPLDNDNKVIYIYLPSGRSKLDIGLYNIIVKNSVSNPEPIEYGVFSIVPKGEFVPNEDFVQKTSDTKGDLKKYIMTSSDTLELNSRYIDYRDLELDLDEIMGEDVWSRNITYRGYRNDTLNRLITKSKWADATLSNVTLDNYSNDRDILIRIGRAPVTIEDSIKKKIAGRSIKSDFIEVGGSNYKASKLNLTIPFRESNGEGLTLLRYDQETRGIIEVSLGKKEINSIDKRAEVELLNLTKGIFVIVE